MFYWSLERFGIISLIVIMLGGYLVKFRYWGMVQNMFRVYLEYFSIAVNCWILIGEFYWLFLGGEFFVGDF